MRLISFLTLFLLTRLAIAQDCPYYDLKPRFASPSDSIAIRSANGSESKPWHLTHITVFSARNNTPGASYVNFVFADFNKDHVLQIICRRTILPGDYPSTPDDPCSYYECQDRNVQFMYYNGTFQIARRYKDPSLGPPGMDFATAFGNATIKVNKVAGECGTKTTATKVTVPITSMISDS